MESQLTEKVFKALESFRIEIPSWGFANTGTRFGKFMQLGAAGTIEEKFADAGQVHSLTGVCPTVALHVIWDFPQGLSSVHEVAGLADKYGVRPGSINPNLFQDQIYKHGSFGSPDEKARNEALEHSKDSIAIAGGLRTRAGRSHGCPSCGRGPEGQHLLRQDDGHGERAAGGRHG